MVMVTMAEEPLAPQLILFGGTFDPPHAGHMDCVAFARQRFPLAQIEILPAYRPPVSREGEKLPDASFADRVAMCRIAFGTLMSTAPIGGRVHISTIEETLPFPNYTIQTLQHVRATRPEVKRLAWLMGSDQIHNLPNWKSPEKLLQLADLIVIGREQTTPLVDDVRSALADLDLQEVVWQEDAGDFVSKLCRVYCIDMKTMPAASHILRHNLSRSTLLPQGWVPSEVVDYIVHKNIYGKGKP